VSDHVHIMVFDLVGRRSIAPSQKAMDEMEAYVRRAGAYGLDELELAADLEEQWPNARRRLRVERTADGRFCVVITPVTEADRAAGLAGWEAGGRPRKLPPDRPR